jgi:hypothetical protein
MFVCGVDGVAEAVGVGEGAEVEDVGEVGAGDGEAAGGGAGGDQEGVEGDLLSVVEADGVAADVELGGAAVGAEVDVVVGVPGGVVDEEVLVAFEAEEVIAGEEGPVVGAVDFLADEEEGAGGVEGADGAGGGGGGGAGTDEDVLEVGLSHL